MNTAVTAVERGDPAVILLSDRTPTAAIGPRTGSCSDAAAGLGSMVGFKTSEADKGQRAILAKAIETMAAVPGAAITVTALRDMIEQQDDALLNAIGGTYPENYYKIRLQM
jgi:hypothetical protein